MYKTDGRKTLRAHWPPRRHQAMTFSVDYDEYRELWVAADRHNHSLQDEIRQRIEAGRKNYPENADERFVAEANKPARLPTWPPPGMRKRGRPKKPA